ncbi:MAG: MFS transporter, partial [Candidatus Enteromonas sp.]
MDSETKKEKARRISAILLLGLFGQIAWAIENNYINLWVFSQSHNTDHIAWMTTGSAIVATLATFFVGALSDRLGKRKPFIAGGYTIWGIFVFLFGVMSLPNMEVLGGSRATGLILVGVMNLVVDCVMTFFGSSANDACFNAFVTEATNEKERPFLETLLSVMPLVSLGIMMLAGLALGIPDASKTEAEIAGPWFTFFLLFGALTTLVGIVSFFLLPKDKVVPCRQEGYFSHMVSGFKPSSVKANPSFYIALLSFLCFNVAVDAFLPYFMVYFQNLPSFSGTNFYVALGSIMGAASLLVILLGAFLEKIGKRKVLVPAVVLMAIGAIGLFFSGDDLGWSIGLGILLIGGYLVGTASLGAEIRDQTPAGDSEKLRPR